jgi:hypothetical protein
MFSPCHRLFFVTAALAVGGLDLCACGGGSGDAPTMSDRQVAPDAGTVTAPNGPADPQSTPDASTAANDAQSEGADRPTGQDTGGGPIDASQGHDAGAHDGGANGGMDAGSADAESGPHPTPGVCMPDALGTGNSMHVGAYCTAGGGQCGQYNLACAIDLDPMGGNFCIKLFCGGNTDCGESACCTGRAGNPIKACVPLGCVDQDAGVCPM